jgi:hypothetical protein
VAGLIGGMVASYVMSTFRGNRPLGVAAPYIGQLVEARLGKEWFHVANRLAVRPVRQGLDALYQGERDLASQDIPTSARPCRRSIMCPMETA